MLRYKKLLYKIINEYLDLKYITHTCCKNCIAYKHCKSKVCGTLCKENIVEALKEEQNERRKYFIRNRHRRHTR